MSEPPNLQEEVYIPFSFPSAIQSITLHVTKGTPPNQTTYTETIPYAFNGENSFAVTNRQLIDDFSNKPPGTKYSYYVTTNYVAGTFTTGDVLTTPTVSNVSVKAIPSLYMTPYTYNPTTQDGYVSQCYSTSSDAPLNYTTGDRNVCIIESGTDKIIPMGTGITDLTCSQSSNSEYEQWTTRSTIYISLPRSTAASVTFVPLIRLFNNITIRYTGNPFAIPANMPLFIQADIRRTGTPEWFAIVDDRHRQAISNYARTLSSGIDFFTPPGESTPVLFNNIVTTFITDMTGMFASASTFNSDIRSWDTWHVWNMTSMFQNARMFNQPLNDWDTSRVAYMVRMFAGAETFNQHIEMWNTVSVRDMSNMFSNARAFNQHIGNWITINVTNMVGMFFNAQAFNQDISTWNTRAVTNMMGMFSNAHAFNVPIGTWNTISVRDMSSMFFNAQAFNQPIGSWDTRAVLDMMGMFGGARAFNQFLGGWVTNSVTNMYAMFNGASNFNNGQPTNINFNGFILPWDVSNVTSMGFMFYNTQFSINISNWVINVNSNFSSFRGGTCPLLDKFTPLVIRSAPGGGR